MDSDSKSMWMACPVCGADSKPLGGSLRICTGCEIEAPTAFWCIPDELYELRSKNSELAGSLAVAEKAIEALTYSVIQELGGTVEGRPTNKLNYLQRIRQLVRIEKALDDERVARGVMLAFWRRVHGSADMAEYDKQALTAHMLTALSGVEAFSREKENG